MRKLDIGGHEYKVKMMDGDKNASDGKLLFGLNNPRTCEIFLDEKLVTSRRNETFLHEVIHVILVNTGCDHDEGLIESLANGFHQLGVGEYLGDNAVKDETYMDAFKDLSVYGVIAQLVSERVWGK